MSSTLMQMYFRVPGPPVPQPRQRSRVVMSHPRADRPARFFAQNYTPKDHLVQSFKRRIREAIAEVYPGHSCSIAPAFKRSLLSVRLTFVFARPQRLVWRTRPMPRLWAECTADLDNLAKAVLDALTGFLFVDDRQVCSLQVLKVYAAGHERPATEIAVRTLGESGEAQGSLFS